MSQAFKRDSKPESASVALFTFDTYFSLVLLYDYLGNRQSQTSSTFLIGVRGVYLLELIKDTSQFFLGNSTSAVRYRHFDHAIAFASALRICFDSGALSFGTDTLYITDPASAVVMPLEASKLEI